jgi:hypothetical protein
MKKKITEYFTKKLGNNFYYFEKTYQIAEQFEATSLTNYQLNDPELVKIRKLYKLIKNNSNRTVTNQYITIFTVAYHKVCFNEIELEKTFDCYNNYESDTFLYGSILVAIKNYLTECINEPHDKMIISKITQLINEYFNIEFEVTTFDDRIMHT